MDLADIPGVQETTLEILREAGITQVTHLLSLPVSEISRVSGCREDAARDVLACIHSALGARRKEGASRIETSSLLPTGVHSLDEALKGGLRQASVVQVAGHSASGKTQLALSIVASALKEKHGVAWIGAGDGHVQSRLIRVLKERHEQNVELCLRDIIFFQVADTPSAVDCVDGIADDCVAVRTAGPEMFIPHDSEQRDAGGDDSKQFPNFFPHVLHRMRLVVFDSPAHVLSTVLGMKAADGWSGHVAINQLATSLRALATSTLATVFITNRLLDVRKDAFPFADGHQFVGLGKSWTFLPDVQIVLETMCEQMGCENWAVNDSSTLSIKKCHHTQASIASKTAQCRSCVMQITSAGVVDV